MLVSLIPALVLALGLRGNRRTLEGRLGRWRCRLWIPIFYYVAILSVALLGHTKISGAYNMTLSSVVGRQAGGTLEFRDSRRGVVGIKIHNLMWHDTGEFVWGPQPRLLDSTRVDGELHSIWHWGDAGIGWIHGLPDPQGHLKTLRYISLPREGGNPLTLLDQGVVQLESRGFPQWMLIGAWLAGLSALAIVLMAAWRLSGPHVARGTVDLLICFFLSFVVLAGVAGRFGISKSDLWPEDYSELTGLVGAWRLSVKAGRGDTDSVGDAKVILEEGRLRLLGTLDPVPPSEGYNWSSKSVAVTGDGFLVLDYGAAAGQGDEGLAVLALKQGPPRTMFGGYIDVGGGNVDTGSLLFTQIDNQE